MSGWSYSLTIGSLLEYAAQSEPNQIVSYRGKEDLTYSNFRERSIKLARALRHNGLENGNVVAVMDWDSVRYLECYYGIPMSGGVLHTVNIRYPPELILQTVLHAEDSFLMVRDEFLPMIAPAKDLLAQLKNIVVFSDTGKFERFLPNMMEYEEFISSGEAPLPEISEDMTATTFYTSGTTGNPKGVSFTHRQIVLHTMAEMSSINAPPLAITSSDVIMPLVPMFHVHSWGLPYTSLVKGMKYILPGRYDYGEILEIIRDQKVTVSAMVPPILFMILNHEKAAEILPKAKLRTIIGGGAMSKGLFAMSRKLGVEALGGYGMSETCPLLTISVYNNTVQAMPEEERLAFNTTAGIPVSFVELRVVDEDGKDVPNDSRSIGEIVARAPWLTSGYVKDPEATRELWRGGWLHTGDMAMIDGYGYVRIVDRAKDAVKSGGEFIPTILLEDHISTCPGVLEVAVVGKRDEKWGERPVAFVRGSEGLDGNVIRKHLSSLVDQGKISKFWIPDEFILVSEFEKTSTGKIDKKPLKAKVLSRD